MNAYLMSDNNNVSIKVVKFDGIDKTVISKRTEYGKKCLLSSILNILVYFTSINVTRIDVNKPQREEKFLFDFLSFKEALINACVHNDWNQSIPPSIYIFDDRVEIVSYGGLPYALSLEGFFSGLSVPVNKSLLTIFLISQFAEQSGHGIPLIVEKYGKNIFSFDNQIIKVSIPFSFDREDVLERKYSELLQKKLKSSTKSSESNKEKVLFYLKNNKFATLEEASKNCDLSLGAVKKICKILKDSGVLKRNGSKKIRFLGSW